MIIINALQKLFGLRRRRGDSKSGFIKSCSMILLKEAVPDTNQRRIVSSEVIVYAWLLSTVVFCFTAAHWRLVTSFIVALIESLVVLLGYNHVVIIRSREKDTTVTTPATVILFATIQLIMLLVPILMIVFCMFTERTKLFAKVYDAYRIAQLGVFEAFRD